MKANLVCITTIVAALAITSADAETVKSIKTARGDALEVIEDVPAGSGPFPAVVLAPGGSYHARAPIPEQLSKALVANGIAVFRFNWSYFPADGRAGRQPDDWSIEDENMKAAYEAARTDPRVDASRIVIAGKSRGSIAAWRLFRTVPAARGALLLTPVCSRQSKENPVPQAEDHYQDSASEKRLVLMTSGDRDPFCSIPVLYRYAGSFGAPLRISVIGGNHSYDLPGDRKDPVIARQNAANVELAGTIAVDFVRTVLK